MAFDLEKIATEHAESVCSGRFPVEYEREQVVFHTKNDIIRGAEYYRQHVLEVLKENYEATKKLTYFDVVRPNKEMLAETYEDLISIFGGNVE